MIHTKIEIISKFTVRQYFWYFKRILPFVGELKYHGAKFLHLKVMGENQNEIILEEKTLCKPW